MCHFLVTGTDNMDNICRKILQQELDLTLALCHHEKQRNEVQLCCSIQNCICVQTCISSCFWVGLVVRNFFVYAIRL